MSSASSESEHLDEEPPTIFLLLENPTKNNNLGPFIRCASAFGISTIVAVGFAKCSDKGAQRPYAGCFYVQALFLSFADPCLASWVG